MVLLGKAKAMLTQMRLEGLSVHVFFESPEVVVADRQVVYLALALHCRHDAWANGRQSFTMVRGWLSGWAAFYRKADEDRALEEHRARARPRLGAW